MAQAILESTAIEMTNTEAANPGYQAYQILHLGFTVAPIVAGLDKFFHLLVNWDQYLPGFVNNMTGGRGHELMLVAGVIEVVAGLGVWFKPRLFAYVVSAWLLLIIANLLLIPGYFDVALRDFGLALAALALGRLSQKFSVLEGFKGTKLELGRCALRRSIRSDYCLSSSNCRSASRIRLVLLAA